MPIQIHSPVLNFLGYLLVAISVWTISIAAYTKVTPIKEWELIPAGNMAAALSLAGAALGLALPIGSLVIHAVNIIDMLLWSVVSIAVQILFYVLAGRWARRVSALVEADNRAVGLTAGSFALCIGVFVACALTY